MYCICNKHTSAGNHAINQCSCLPCSSCTLATSSQQSCHNAYFSAQQASRQVSQQGVLMSEESSKPWGRVCIQHMKRRERLDLLQLRVSCSHITIIRQLQYNHNKIDIHSHGEQGPFVAASPHPTTAGDSRHYECGELWSGHDTRKTQSDKWTTTTTKATCKKWTLWRREVKSYFKAAFYWNSVRTRRTRRTRNNSPQLYQYLDEYQPRYLTHLPYEEHAPTCAAVTP